MKTTFETNKKTYNDNSFATMREVRESIIQFFVRNGMDYKFACESVEEPYTNSDLKLKFDCANHDYSRAISFLILLSTLPESGFYISFRTDYIEFTINCDRYASFKQVIDMLEKNWKITIEN